MSAAGYSFPSVATTVLICALILTLGETTASQSTWRALITLKATVPRAVVACDSPLIRKSLRRLTEHSGPGGPARCPARGPYAPKFTDFFVLEVTAEPSVVKQSVVDAMQSLAEGGDQDVAAMLPLMDVDVYRDIAARAPQQSSSSTDEDGMVEGQVNGSSLVGHRHLLQAGRTAGSVDVVEAKNIRRVWEGFGSRGSGANVGLFDTGIATRHDSFRGSKVLQCAGYTTQGKTCEDGFGHGSFVAGVVAGRAEGRCPGIAPDANLFVYKVFSDQQVSYTSWFLDAMNEGMQRTGDARLDVINLSVGGMDYFDRPFVDKILETSSLGITVVTAIGNEGPLHGTCFNPGDQLDVIGVGAHTGGGHIAPFSSRGMTTWEMPFGVGRPKPDVVTHGDKLWGTFYSGGCRELSGTSVAAPVVTGGMALVVAALKKRKLTPNPGALRQILMETSKVLHWDVDRDLKDYTMFAQGAGAMDIDAAVAFATHKYRPHLSAHPSTLHIHFDRSVRVDPHKLEEHHMIKKRKFEGRAASEGKKVTPNSYTTTQSLGYMDPSCVYWWPHCEQELFYTSTPLVVNVTILNSHSPVAALDGIDVEFDETPHKEFRDLVDVSVNASEMLWPWAGAAAVSFTVLKPLPSFIRDVKVSGTISVAYRVASVGSKESDPQHHRHRVVSVSIPFSVRVIHTPPRNRRVLWDLHHQLMYPPGFIPRDNLDNRNDLLDWHGDHPFTNFADTYQYLRRGLGLSVDLMTSQDFTHLNASRYGAMILVDPEEYYFPEEIVALEEAVRSHGMGLIVFSDWYDTALMDKLGFTDDNTNLYWKPITGGSNVPGLNDLLAPFGIQLASSAVSGVLDFGTEKARSMPHVSSGGTLFSVPKSPSTVVCRNVIQLMDTRGQMLGTGAARVRDAPLLVLHQSLPLCRKPGRSPKTASSGQKANVPILDQDADEDASPKMGGSAGRVAVFTDSNCLDAASINGGYCHEMLQELLSFVVNNSRSGQHLRARGCRGVLKGDSQVSGGCTDGRPGSVVVAATGQHVVPGFHGDQDPLSEASAVIAAHNRVHEARNARPDRPFPREGDVQAIKRQHPFAFTDPPLGSVVPNASDTAGYFNEDPAKGSQEVRRRRRRKKKSANATTSSPSLDDPEHHARLHRYRTHLLRNFMFLVLLATAAMFVYTHRSKKHATSGGSGGGVHPLVAARTRHQKTAAKSSSWMPRPSSKQSLED